MLTEASVPGLQDLVESAEVLTLSANSALGQALAVDACI